MSKKLDHFVLPNQPSTLTDSIPTAATRAVLIAALVTTACGPKTTSTPAVDLSVDLSAGQVTKEIDDNSMEVEVSHSRNRCFKIVESPDYTVRSDFKEGVAVAEDKDGRMFHIDQQGQPIYSARYDFVENYSEGAAAARESEKMFHIDKKGQALYPERYDEVRHFSEGAAYVNAEDGTFFHIDKTGKPLYSEKYYGPHYRKHIRVRGVYYYDYGDFSEGAAAVQDKNDRMFHINKNGQPLYSNRYDYVSPFYESAAVALDKSKKETFHIGIDGQPLHTHRFNRASNFNEGAARVNLNSHIDKEGEFLYPLRSWTPMMAGNYHEGFAWVCTNPFRKGSSTTPFRRGLCTSFWHIDKSGKPLLDDKDGKLNFVEPYRVAYDFNEGAALVADTKGGYFHIDRQGKPLYPERYYFAYSFSEGAAAIAPNAPSMKATFHINKKGQPLYSERYAEVEGFNEGAARVRKGRNWFFIKKNEANPNDECEELLGLK